MVLLSCILHKVKENNRKYFKSYIGYFLCLIPLLVYFIYCWYFEEPRSGSIILGILGSIFSLLKLKLDQTNYQRSLFEDRFAVLKECDDILFCCFHGESKSGETVDSRLLSKKLDSFYRRSYFLFGHQTYTFLTEFRKAVLDYAYINDSGDMIKKTEAEKFLSNLLNEQTLAKYFKELKIASYI